MAIRVALGASRRQVLWLVVKEGAWVSAAGHRGRSVSGRSAGATLSSELHGVSPLDPITYVSVAGVMAIVTLAACASRLGARSVTRWSHSERGSRTSDCASKRLGQTWERCMHRRDFIKKSAAAFALAGVAQIRRAACRDAEARRADRLRLVRQERSASADAGRAGRRRLAVRRRSSRCWPRRPTSSRRDRSRRRSREPTATIARCCAERISISS